MCLTNGLQSITQTHKVRELGDPSQIFPPTHDLSEAPRAFKGPDTQAAPWSVSLRLKDSST